MSVPYPKQDPMGNPVDGGYYGVQPPPYGMQPQVHQPYGAPTPQYGVQPQVHQPYGAPTPQYGVQPPAYAAPPGAVAYSYGNPQLVQDASSGPSVHRNYPDAPKDDERGQGFADSFNDKNIRRAFVRKVYLILLCQLSVTLGFICLFVFHKGVRRVVHEHIYIYIIAYVVFLTTYISLVCCTGLRRKHPWNLIFLSIFTLAMSYMTGCMSSFHDTHIVLIAIGICAVVCLGITLFSIQTKYDITGCGLFLCVLSLVVFVFGIVAIFTRDRIMDTVYAGLIAVVFSLYLAYDTQMLVGGRKYELSPEEHVFGALALYMDVVMIFIAILGLAKAGD